MTSKQELEKLIESILEQGKVVTARPDLILNINIENFIPIIERACEELDRIEELKKDIVTAYESNKLLRKENAKLKKVIEDIKNLPNCDICDANWHKGCMCLQKKIKKTLLIDNFENMFINCKLTPLPEVISKQLEELQDDR